MSIKPNFESIVERAKLEILADVQNGTHPALFDYSAFSAR
jgi:hypothetical protein